MNYFVHSVSRCGQHAFCNWLRAQIGDCGFVNSYQEISRGTGDDLYLHHQRDSNGKNNVVLTENHHADMVEGGLRADKRIVLLRRPGNWIASLFKSRKRSISELEGFLSKYRYLFTNRRSLGYPVVFDQWVTSESYRIKICEDLGLTTERVNDTLNQVTHYGGGSSFSGMEFDGDAQNMAVTKRGQEALSGRIPEISAEVFEFIMSDYTLNLAEETLWDYDVKSKTVK